MAEPLLLDLSQWIVFSGIPSTSGITGESAEGEANAANISHATTAADLATKDTHKPEKT